MHSRYSPTTLNPTHPHSPGRCRRPKKMPNTGTSTTYNAVKKPALAVLVPPTPNCWAALAANSTVPQISPPRHSRRGACQNGAPGARRRPRTSASTARKAQPSQLRQAKKV